MIEKMDHKDRQIALLNKKIARLEKELGMVEKPEIPKEEMEAELKALKERTKRAITTSDVLRIKELEELLGISPKAPASGEAGDTEGKKE